MPGKLLQELHRGRPFETTEMEVFLNIVRTADLLMREFDELFKPYGLSATQFNVLRILKNAPEPELPCKAIAQRMITRDPDITRLLDRLEARNLITRERGSKDRRVVAARITEQGLSLLQELEPHMIECHKRQLEHMDPAKLEQVIELHEQIRKVD